MSTEEIDTMFPSVLPDEARLKGFCPITTPYVLPRQIAMLSNCISDYNRADADFLLVRRKDRIQGGYGYRQLEVWRRSKHKRAAAVKEEARPSIFACFWSWGDDVAVQ